MPFSNVITIANAIDVAKPFVSGQTTIWEPSRNLFIFSPLGSGGSSSSSGITSLNGLTNTTQTFAVNTSGPSFAISSTGSTHTFSLPNASPTASGAVTPDTQTFAGLKTFNNYVGIGVAANPGTGLYVSLASANHSAIVVQAPAGQIEHVIKSLHNGATNFYVNNSGSIVGASIAGSYINTTGNINLTPNQYNITANAVLANIQLLLPNTSTVPNGKEYRIKRIDNNIPTFTVVISGSAGQLIDGQNTLSLDTQYESYILVRGDTHWYIW